MEKEFVPYELALRMKALGFKESGCFGFWDIKGDLISERIHVNEYTIGDWNSHPNRISSPTWQQSFRWFRDNYDLDCVIAPRPLIEFFYQSDFEGSLDKRYCIDIIDPKDVSDFKNDIYRTNFVSYEAAEVVALTKLIEILELR
jgi:hypothetical protein